MEYYITKEQLEEYLILPKTFDWDLVDQELGFGKIFEIIPEEIYLQIKISVEIKQKEIFRLLTKAAVHYSFVLSIPKIKVHINNIGISNFDDPKLKPAPWWDVRDLGLSLLKFADKLFSESLDKIAEVPALKLQVPFFQKVSEYISTPSEFENIYSINYSPEVFLMLQRFLKQALMLKVYENIKPECVDQIKANPELYEFFKDAIVFYSLYYASLLPSFVFLQNAVVIQYEELPWQKSQVLSPDAKMMSGKNFLKLANESLKVISDYMKSHSSEFPCYSGPEPDRLMQARDSGIYLT
ncbi:DUF6712 family protein [Chryseobacterium indologenes]|uniref:DUF6712 family protein n=1 Tax=Chryseobacterium indologenes TaxID=253 RepID=UPI00162727DA|nr:DUF6712 family protein [Chryseobacterium indologenes]